MSNLTRREAMGTAAVGVAGAALAGAAASEAVAQDKVRAAAFAGNHTPKPLRFDPAKLTELSERLIASHWENNYQGSVRGLNTIEARLAAAMADPDYPTVAYSGLKREELHRTGSVVLHELYFGALGGNGNPGGSIYEALDSWFGSYEAWEAEFRRTAISLAGGSGKCVLWRDSHNRIFCFIFQCLMLLVPQKRHHIQPLFSALFRYLGNSAYAKSPQKARKNRIMHWFDAFFGTRNCLSGFA